MDDKKRQVTGREIENRRREALAAAEACAELLKTRFNARRVIPFGSVVGEGPWHDGSDLDLAVEGLSPEQVWRAERELARLLPQGLQLDLIPLEAMRPAVRARVVKEVPMPEEAHAALRVFLRDTRDALEQVLQENENLLRTIGECEPTSVEVRALSTLIEDFYSGLERFCERVAWRLDRALPEGREWHVRLLAQMAEAQPGVRPALWTPEQREMLDEYRRFRHRVRHIYRFDLDWPRVMALARELGSVWETVRESLAAFEAWLEAQTRASSEQPGE